MWLLVREVIGWILMALGLYLIFLVVGQIRQRFVLEAIALAFPATVVFRAGIGMVRLAAAGRVAKDLRQETLQEMGVTRRLSR